MCISRLGNISEDSKAPVRPKNTNRWTLSWEYRCVLPSCCLKPLTCQRGDSLTCALVEHFHISLDKQLFTSKKFGFEVWEMFTVCSAQSQSLCKERLQQFYFVSTLFSCHSWLFVGVFKAWFSVLLFVFMMHEWAMTEGTIAGTDGSLYLWQTEWKSAK